MIILDKKSYELLFYLLKLDEPQTVMAISKTLNQSRRKIYYHLDKINEALPSTLDKIVSYPRVGIVLTAEQKAACWSLIEDLDDYNYVLQVKERLQLMLVYTAISKERVTIERLMSLTDVSRNTVLSDIASIRQELSQNHPTMRLEVTKARGYYLSASPLTVIRYLYQLLAEIYTSGTENFIGIMEDKLTKADLGEIYFSEELLTFFEEQLKNAKIYLGKTLNRQESILMLKTLPFLILCYRHLPLTDSDRLTLQEELLMTEERKEHHLAQMIAQGLREAFDFDLDAIEILLIALLLLSYRKDSDSHLESRDYEQMRAVLNQFVDLFEETYARHFVNKEDLVKQLLLHCKALVYRKTYGMVTQNPLTQHIKDKYAQLFYMTHSCVGLLEKAWEINLTDDDVAYLTIHLGGALQQATQEKSYRICIVCDEGIAIQKLLLSQCRRYIKTSTVEAVFTSAQFHSVRDILTSDLVVTTVDLDYSPVPVLRIQPILTNDDLVRLLRFVANGGQEDSQGLTAQLERYIRRYVKDETDIYVLRNKIEKVVQKEMLRTIMLGQDRED